MITEAFPLFIVMTLTIAFSYLLAAKWRAAQRFGVVMLVILFGMILGNLDVVGQDAALYDPWVGHLIPLSIALFLFRLDFRELRNLGGPMLRYFLIGALATFIGGIVTWLCFGAMIGPDAMKLAGQLTASYIGGGENAVAVAEALGLRTGNPDLYTAAFAADNVVTAIWMLVALSAPFGLSRFFSNEMDQRQIEAAKENTERYSSTEFLPSCFYSLALAGGIVWMSRLIAAPIRSFATEHGWQWLQFNTTIIWVTTIALIVAQTPLRRHLKVAYSVGMLLFLYFFFSMGAISDIGKIIELGPVVFVFTATIVGVHGIIILSIGWLCKADMGTVFLASQCNIGGPSTAVALAEANGWHHLVLPSILLGVLGYAIANYLGVFIAQIVLPMLG